MLKKGTTFFGDGDRMKFGANKGKISVAFPQWYFKQHIEEIKRQIEQKERQIKSGLLDATAMLIAKQQTEELRNKLSMILSGVPEINAKEKDYLSKFYKWSSAVLSDELFSRSEMQMGLADPRVILERESNKYINIRNFIDIAKAANIKVAKDKVNLKDIQIMWKIVGKILGEPTNTEWVRQEKRTNVYKKSKSLEEIEAELGV